MGNAIFRSYKLWLDFLCFHLVVGNRHPNEMHTSFLYLSTYVILPPLFSTSGAAGSMGTMYINSWKIVQNAINPFIYQVAFGQFPHQFLGCFACFWSRPCAPASPLGPQCRIALPPLGPPAVRVRDVMARVKTQNNLAKACSS